MTFLKKIKLYLSLPFMSLFTVLSRQSLARTPEPEAISDQVIQVQNYDAVMNTSLSISYALVINIINNLVTAKKSLRYLDLCCGPGHFTRLTTENFDICKTVLVDLSQGMLDVAQKNMAALPTPTQFICDDVTRLQQLQGQTFDLITFTNGLHHLPTLDDVKKVFGMMDALSDPEGYIVIIDPVRPKSKFLADYYIALFGSDNLDQGLDDFQNDFKYSVFASWTYEEMAQCAPKDSAKYWYHVTPLGFPFFQMMIGSPSELDAQVFNTRSAQFEALLPQRFLFEFRMLNLNFKLGRIRQL